MSFLDTIRRAKTYLEEQGRVSLSALRREFALDDETLEELVEELVDIQQVAAREGKALAWIGSAAGEPEPATATALQAVPDREPAPEAERRQLTVLFCDLVDSTRLAAGMDPEDWREVVRAYQRAAAEVVERFDGHVAQYLGDGLLVYFGWPRAHEDDAERAVRAGLGIVDAIAAGDERLSVRVGIHTGPVVVGEMGGGASRETLAMGDTTNVAARLQAEAEPDSVVLSAETLRLTPGVFQTEALDALQLKGMENRVTGHRALGGSGVRSRLDVQGRLTPFVGRDMELGLLLDRWEHVVDGVGQTVFLSGEAGLGKSRLLLALRERLGDDPYTWLECRGTAYAQRSALHPVIELVERGLGFTEQDSPEQKLRRLHDALDTESFAVAETAWLLGDFLGLLPTGRTLPPINPELKREKTLDALVAWALALGEVQPVLLLAEDLHWCDPSSVELFGRLAEQVPSSRVLLVLTARPEFVAPWSSSTNWTPIVLGRLHRRHAREVVASLSNDLQLPEVAVEQIVTRGDGIPLYLEELTRAAIQSGKAGGEGLDVAVPSTLQDSLMARLDRLSTAKEVAQLAAPLGREFPYRLLAASVDLDEVDLRHRLECLVESDLMLRRGTPPEATYAFRHALIQETAYDSLPRAQRHRVHARVAKALETQFPEKLESEPELVAQHLAHAGQADRAGRMFERAGRRASERAAHQEAIDHFEHALEQLGKLPESAEGKARQLALEVERGSSTNAGRGYAAPELASIWKRARSLARELDDTDALTAALVGLSSFNTFVGDADQAAAHAEELLRLADVKQNRTALMAGHAMMANALQFSPDFERCVHHAEACTQNYVLEEHRELGRLFGSDLGILSYGIAESALRTLGFYDRAAGMIVAARELAERLDHLFDSRVLALLYQCFRLVDLREWTEAEERTNELVVAAEERRYPFYLGFGACLGGVVRVRRDRDQSALADIQSGLAMLASAGVEGGTAYALSLIAEANHALGRFDDGRGAAEAALAIAGEAGQTWWNSELLRVLGLIAQDTGERDEAIARYEDSIRLARAAHARGMEVKSATLLARLLAAEGHRAEARGLLQPVYDWFTEGFDTQDLKDAKALLVELG